MEKYQKILLKVLKLHGDLEKNLDEAAMIISSELDISRVSFWRGGRSLGGITCIALYNSASKSLERGTFLSSSLYPTYFETLEKEIILDVYDACEDRRTSEFRSNYLLPLKITSMLDAPIIIDGEIRGVICFEHTGEKRVWNNNEKVFASEIAQYVAHCLIQEERFTLEERYKATIENSLDAIYFFKTIRNDDKQIVDFILIDMNLKATQEQRTTKDALLGHSIRTFFPWANEEEHFFKYVQIAKNRGYFECEYSIAAGEVGAGEFYHQAHHLKDGIVVFNRNITAQKNYEIKIRQEKEKLYTLINALPTYFFFKDNLGHFVEMNEAMASFFGRSVRDVIGKTVYDLYPADEAQQHHYVDLKVLRSGKIEVYESRCEREGKPSQAIVFTKAPMRDAYGNIIGVVGMGLDVTERNIADEQRHRMQAQLVQTSKLTSIGTLATGVAHEINNPLTVCFGFLGVLEEVLDEKNIFEGDLKSSVTSIHNSLERIRVIVKELRTYARSDTDKVEYVDFHESLNSTLLLCRSLFEKESIHIKLQLDCSKPLFLGNRSSTQQVVMNILTNARDAIIDANKKSGEITVRTSLEDGHILIDFVDNGCGIAPDIEDKIFDPFFTTKEPNRGSGLGLSIVQSIVHAASGEIQALSGVKEGAIFRLSLPLADIARQMDQQEMQAKNLKKNIPRVLIVDDEPDIVDLLQTIFLAWDFQVDKAGGGQEALQKIFGENSYDLILSDYRMPGLDGVKMLSEARRRGFAGKSLLLTGFLGDLTAKNVEEITLCADDVLRKPFSREMLFGVLKRLGFKFGV